MKKHRDGAPKKLHFRHDPWGKYQLGEKWVTGRFEAVFNPSILEMYPKDLMRILAKRYEELKARNYPDEWIEKDLIKLMEGI